MALKDLMKTARKLECGGIEDEFLVDMEKAIELRNEDNKRPSSTYFKPSSVGGCYRSNYYIRVGMEKDTKIIGSGTIGIFNSGTDRHDRVQTPMVDGYLSDFEWVDVAQYLKERPYLSTKVVERVGNEVKCFNPDYELRFMTDGILKHKRTGKYYIFEFKTEASFKFDKRVGIEPKHKYQGLCYSLSFDIPNIIFVYENRNLCGKKAYLYNADDNEMKTLTDFISTVNNFVETKELPPKTENARECRYCDYKEACKIGKSI